MQKVTNKLLTTLLTGKKEIKQYKSTNYKHYQQY